MNFLTGLSVAFFFVAAILLKHIYNIKMYSDAILSTTCYVFNFMFTTEYFWTNALIELNGISQNRARKFI